MYVGSKASCFYLVSFVHPLRRSHAGLQIQASAVIFCFVSFQSGLNKERSHRKIGSIIISYPNKVFCCLMDCCKILSGRLFPHFEKCFCCMGLIVVQTCVSAEKCIFGQIDAFCFGSSVYHSSKLSISKSKRLSPALCRDFSYDLHSFSSTLFVYCLSHCTISLTAEQGKSLRICTGSRACLFFDCSGCHAAYDVALSQHIHDDHRKTSQNDVGKHIVPVAFVFSCKLIYGHGHGEHGAFAG